ncbi:TetR/AcrR family transcriptional regulator [Nocardioides plantarum]|uniref:TetR/AcrR family transcriptional regulator n=2 Tax=Nocardioides plantarum TaxID=29299 RepID=A0ABV5K6J8_9ACTN|nr:helix-turn-helix domain-containing protein [Nocardioides plantarum]
MDGRGDMSDLGRACDAAVHLLATRGAGGLSVRAIAHELNVTGPALTHRWDNRARLWGLLVSEIGDRWLREVRRAVYDRGPAGLVPSTAEEVADACVWLTASDLGRTDPVLSFRVADVLEQERALLRRALEERAGRRLADAVVDALHATAVGLRDRVCSVGQPFPGDQALVAWHLAVEALVPTGASLGGQDSA